MAPKKRLEWTNAVQFAENQNKDLKSLFNDFYNRQDENDKGDQLALRRKLSQLEDELFMARRDTSSIRKENDILLRRKLAEMTELFYQSCRAATRKKEICVVLPAPNPSGTVDFGLWVPGHKSVVERISIGYLTDPASAAGAVTLQLYKSSGPTALLSAAYDLEAGTGDGVLSTTKSTVTLAVGEYIYGTITSDAAIETLGAGGVLTLEYCGS